MLSQDVVIEMFDYNKKTGDMVWKKPRQGVRVGERAGTAVTNHKGKTYIRVSVFWKKYLLHRLIYLWVTGEMPTHLIDHIDGDGTNNRWKNLRTATPLQNAQNARKPRDNTSGHVGVYWSKQASKWKAMIRVQKKLIFLGYFNCIEEAVSKRKKAETLYGFHPNHGTDRPL